MRMSLNPPIGRSLPTSWRPLRTRWILGTSKTPMSTCSRTLLELAIRLHGLMTRSGVKMQIFHVACTCMIIQGLTQSLAGKWVRVLWWASQWWTTYPSSIPRQRKGLRLLCPGFVTLARRTPLSWSQKGGLSQGTVLRDGYWEVPVLSAHSYQRFGGLLSGLRHKVSLAELQKATIKRQKACHIFVCPRLCTTQRAKQLYQASDIVSNCLLDFRAGLLLCMNPCSSASSSPFTASSLAD